MWEMDEKGEVCLSGSCGMSMTTAEEIWVAWREGIREDGTLTEAGFVSGSLPTLHDEYTGQISLFVVNNI